MRKISMLIEPLKVNIYFLMIFFVFVPISPIFPTLGLDPSWKIGLGQALFRDFSFGKDVIFTFGPFSSIYTMLYRPEVDQFMIFGSIYLAIIYCVAFLIVVRSAPWYLALIPLLVLGGLNHPRDSILFSVPLLIVFASYKLTTEHCEWLRTSRWALLLIAVLFSPNGLLPLVKGSMLGLCAVLVALNGAFFLTRRLYRGALVSVTSSVAALMLFWVISGQSLADIPSYISNMMEVAAGYSEAMAFFGPIEQVMIFLVGAALLPVAIAITDTDLKNRIYLLSLTLFFLFISFKAGLIRQDNDHIFIASSSLLIITIMICFVIRIRFLVSTLVVAAAIWVYFGGTVRSGDTFTSFWRNLDGRLAGEDSLRKQYEASLEGIRLRMPLPLLPGTSDIYSSGQAALIASGNIWNPRPIFQSYSAYSMTLLQLNKAHLLGIKAPDNIFFAVEPIDKHYPSLEDGVSWPILLGYYQPLRFENNYVILGKRERRGEVVLTPFTEATPSLGEVVHLPDVEVPLFAQVDVQPTFLGRLANLLFRTADLEIEIVTQSGQPQKYHFIAGMGRSGFVLSPLVSHQEDFGFLYGRPWVLDSNKVKSVMITTPLLGRILWRKTYGLILSRMDNKNPIDLSELYKPYSVDGRLSASSAVQMEQCDGFIDQINGERPLDVEQTISHDLAISGWVALSTVEGRLPSAVYVVLTDEAGNRHLATTTRTLRPDVGAAFRKPSLEGAGYQAVTDVSVMKGHYRLGLAVERDGQVALCRQFDKRINIVP